MVEFEKVDESELTKEMVSTGHTLLDLDISGNVNKYGGIPGGLMLELYGPSGHGKSTLGYELMAQVQKLGGIVLFGDAEQSLNKEYASKIGVNFDEEFFQYSSVNTIEELYNLIKSFFTNEKYNNRWKLFVEDSVTALSTEMEADDKDKTGMTRAKAMSTLCRKIIRIISGEKSIVLWINQERDNIDNMGGFGGKKTISPGGRALKFYSHLVFRLGPAASWKNKETKEFGKLKEERITSINSVVSVEKSRLNTPWRKREITLIHGYGVDDIGDSLQFLKDFYKDTMYVLKGEKLGKSLKEAVKIIEKNDLEKELKEEVIKCWNEIEMAFNENLLDRKPKVR
jgi:recombination protein RecA